MLPPELVVKACEFELFSEHLFMDRQLLFDAVVSKGYPNEHPELAPVHRQAILANMGDAVIDVLTTEHLIVHDHIADAGEVTKARERMVKGSVLDDLGRETILRFVAMTSGEENEVHHSSTPGESLEAMVGALYLDGGLAAAMVFLEKLDFFKKEDK